MYSGVLNILVQSGMTALMLVSNENYVDVAKLLLKHGASVQATDEVCTCMFLCEIFVMRSVCGRKHMNTLNYKILIVV